MNNSVIRGSAYDSVTEDEFLKRDFGTKKVSDWKEVDDKFLEQFATIMIDPLSSEAQALTIDDDLDFNDVFGISYLEEKFPGMDPDILNIIVEDARDNRDELLAGFVDPDSIKIISS